MKKLLRVLVYSLIFLFVLAAVLFKPVDWTPYQNTAYYQHTLNNLDSVKSNLPSNQENGRVKFGWAKANITPAHPVNLIAYGQRGPYQQVHDSAWVKAIVFTNQTQKIVLLAYDLWIIHPFLAAAIRDTLQQAEIQSIYFTADHTHNGYGGWAPGLGGKLIAGGYDADIVRLICKQTVEAVKKAEENIGEGKIGYHQVNASRFVKNRLIENGKTDPWIRILNLEKEQGEKAVFCTFSAHSTYINSSVTDLSSDYPGILVKELVDHDSLDFAAFASGAIGSQAPVKSGEFSYENMNQYADSLAGLIEDNLVNIEERATSELKFIQLPVAVREPHFRISDNWRIRPWLFNWFFGEQHPYFTCMRIGNTILIGSPGEISGEFYPLFSGICKEKNLNLMLTTFNGNYLGYITPDQYYHLKKYETRDMNWFGPYNGEYFVEIITKLLEII